MPRSKVDNISFSALTFHSIRLFHTHPREPSSINQSAPICHTDHGRVNLDLILERDAYAAGSKPFRFENVNKLHQQDPSHSQGHLAGISTVSIPLPVLQGTPQDRLDRLLQQLCWEGQLQGLSTEPFEVMRCKGYLSNKDGRSWGEFGVVSDSPHPIITDN